MSDEERWQYYELQEHDPEAAERYLLARTLGVPVENLDHVISNFGELNDGIEKSRHEVAEVEKFKQRAGDAYRGTSEDAHAILDFLSEHDQEITSDNLYLAFKQLQESGELPGGEQAKQPTDLTNDELRDFILRQR